MREVREKRKSLSGLVLYVNVYTCDTNVKIDRHEHACQFPDMPQDTKKIKINNPFRFIFLKQSLLLLPEKS